MYCVVAPVQGQTPDLKMNTKKLLLLKVDSLNNIEIIDDEITIAKVLDNLF